MDSVFDTRPAPFRILYHHEAEDVHVSFGNETILETHISFCKFIYKLYISVIAIAVHHSEILKDWEWIENNILPTLGLALRGFKDSHLTVTGSFDNEEDVRRFVLTKIEGLCSIEEGALGPIALDKDNISNNAIVHKFHKDFELPADEKLVNCKSLICLISY